MKNYTITVNGNVYDVTVEEGGQGSTGTVPKAILIPKELSAQSLGTFPHIISFFQIII